MFGRGGSSFQDDVTGGAPASARLVKALEITELPWTPVADGEVRCLRTLLVETGTGEAARQTDESDLAAVLRSMVGSYDPGVM